MWRYSWLSKWTTDYYPKYLSIQFLKEHWYLDKNRSLKSWGIEWKINGSNIWLDVSKWEDTGIVRVYFRFIESNEQFDYNIKLVSTKCNYWWIRWWFECPCKWNRCWVLYMQDNWIFASRKSLDLCYSSQKETKRSKYLYSLFWSNTIKAKMLLNTIKYKHRNWKPTRKYERAIKLALKNRPTIENLNKLDLFFSWKRI